MSKPMRPLEERFWEAVCRGDPDECWEWLGAYVSAAGYGRLSLGAPRYGQGYAHRVAWELANGPIPDGLWVLHKCDNRICCNPSHLFLGTQQDNLADMVSKRRHQHGDRHTWSKLNSGAVALIRSLYAAGGCTQKDLAELFRVTRSCVGHIMQGNSWKLVGYR